MRLRRHRAVGAEGSGVQPGVAGDALPLVPRPLHAPRGLDAAANGSARLLVAGRGQRLRRDRFHLDVQVDPVKQRAGDSVQVRADLVGRAPALGGSGPVIAAGLCCAY